MPLQPIPVVTKPTAAGANINDVLTAIRTHVAGSSTKFEVVANTPADDAFTLSPLASGETWHVNLREKDSTTGYITIDPLANITAPGVAGSPGTAPTLTDDTEESGEQEALVIAGTENVDFYVVELDDCFIVLFMNAGKNATPYCWMFGRVYTPVFDDGSNGWNYADGLGFFCGTVEVTTGATSGAMLSSDPSGTNRIRIGQTTWIAPGLAYEVPATKCGDKDGDKVALYFGLVEGLNTDGTSETIVGVTRYIYTQKTSELPGEKMDGGAGNEALVHINDTNAIDSILIPWDRSVTPEF